jgi:hypothetical protein
MNRYAKLAAAAAIIVGLVVWSQIPSSVVPTAYALQDTIEAYSSVRWLHIYESATVCEEPRTSEIWLECDEWGNVNKIRFQSDNAGEPVGPLVLAGNSESSEAWLPRHSLRLIGYGDASVLLRYDISELDPKFLFEKLLDKEKRGEAIVDVNKPAEKAEPIVVTVTYPQGSKSEKWKKVCYIDQATKLATRIEKFELRSKGFEHIKTLEFFDYNQQIDPMMFNLDGDVPDDAKVVDMSEVEVGLLQNELTDRQIAEKLTREFFEAAIDKNFYRAGQLYLGAPDFLVEQAFMGANVLEIISVGPGHREPDPDSKAMNCSCKVLAEFGGQYYEVNAWMVRIINADKETNRWLICGMAVSVNPAPGKITLSESTMGLDEVTYNGLEPGGFMKKWLVLGPLPYYARSDINVFSKEGQQYSFDTDGLDFINFAPLVSVDGTDYEWVVLESEYNNIDLKQLEEEDNAFQIAYLWAQIDMPEEMTGTLGIGSDDGVKVWLNGELLHENWLYRGVVADNDRVPVTFKKGKNQLVLKIQNAMGPWGFCCRLLEE